MTCKGSSRYWNYLKDYWPYAGGLSAVNAIGAQLRDPIELLSLQPMFPPKSFDIPSADRVNAEEVEVRSDFSLNSRLTRWRMAV